MLYEEKHFATGALIYCYSFLVESNLVSGSDLMTLVNFLIRRLSVIFFWGGRVFSVICWAEPGFLNSKEPRNRFPRIDYASLCRLAGGYDKTIPTRFLAPIGCSKIPAQHRREQAWRDQTYISLSPSFNISIIPPPPFSRALILLSLYLCSSIPAVYNQTKGRIVRRQSDRGGAGGRERPKHLQYKDDNWR